MRDIKNIGAITGVFVHDLTDYARSIGYTGDERVTVTDGKIKSPTAYHNFEVGEFFDSIRKANDETET